MATQTRKFGFIFVFSASLLWLVTAFLIEDIVSAHGSKHALVPPFLLTYLATNLLTLYLPLIHIISIIQEWYGWNSRKSGDSGRRGAHEDGKHSPRHSSGGALVHDDPTARMAALWATPIWFGTQYTFNLSLAYTSVTSNTILNSTVSLFAYAFSILLLGEKYMWKKLVCILSCIAGTALVTLADEDKSGDSGPMWGDALVLVSASLYAAYTVVLKWKMPGEEAHNQVAEFFGYLGLFNTILFAPFALIVFWSGDIDLSTIPREAYFYVGLQGLLAFMVADYLWACGVIVIGPTIATVCQSVQIPVAAAADLLLVGNPTWAQSTLSIMMALGGTTFILSGLFGMNMLTKTDEDTSAPVLPKSSPKVVAKGSTGGPKSSRKEGSPAKSAIQMKMHKGGGDVEELTPLRHDREMW